MGVRDFCVPREDVLRGEINDAIFAADFGDLVSDGAPEVYRDPATFFANTHPARELKNIVNKVFRRLSDPTEGGAVYRLSTGFGGGKTHTLMALWHIAKSIDNPDLGSELLPPDMRPGKATVVGIDAGKAGVPVFQEHEGTQVRSLWGEMFWQLAGVEGLDRLGAADDTNASPSNALIKSVLPDGPLLILLDELVIYMAKLSEQGEGNLLGFINSLASIVQSRPQTVLVVTDTAGQSAYSTEAGRIHQVLPQTTTRLDEVLSRSATDYDPIGDETAQVIARRLFKSVDPSAADIVAQRYSELYKRVSDEYPELLSGEYCTSQYRDGFAKSYPFHPRLLLTAQGRLGSMPAFQKSRGVLRLFARIIRNVWEHGWNPDIITAGDIDWMDSAIQGELLHRLERDPFSSAVTADIGNHAASLDGTDPNGLHRRVAGGLLLESLPLESRSGLDVAEMTLSVLRLQDAGPEPSEALDRLLSVCWHTYPMPGERGWQFRYEPNVIKQIEELKARIPDADASMKVQSLVQKYFQGPRFKMVPWPTSPRAVQDAADLQLALCLDPSSAGRVCSFSDDTDVDAPMPRRFRNAIIAIAPSPSSFADAVDRAKKLIATERIENENQGESGRVVRQQIARIKPALEKQLKVQAFRSFDVVVMADGERGKLYEHFQFPEETALTQPKGQESLHKFLEANQLIYKDSDSLDPNRLVDLLQGATPSLEVKGAWKSSSVMERLYAAPNMRLIPEKGFVRRTLQRSIQQGRILVRDISEGTVWTAEQKISGPHGERRSSPHGGRIPLPDLDDETLVTLPTSECSLDWLKEDLGNDGPPDIPPPPPPEPPDTGDGNLTVNGWDQMLEESVRRPLLTLNLKAMHPDASLRLAALGQPFGAREALMTVNISGRLRGGGQANYKVSGFKANSPVQPFVVARTLFSAMETVVAFEAKMNLSFAETGCEGAQERLEAMLKAIRDQGIENISGEAVFGPTGDAQ